MKNKNSRWWHSKTRENMQVILLILAVIFVIGGSIWGGIAQWAAEWDHAISRSEKFHIWFHLWFSPGISVVIGLITLFWFKISMSK